MCSLVFSHGAHAGKKSEAKQHFKAGLALLKVEDFNAAITEFEISIRLYPTKSGLFNLANCYKAIHNYGDSLATYKRLLRDYENDLNPEMRDKANNEIEEILAIVAHLEITAVQKNAVIKLNGVEIFRPLVRSTSAQGNIPSRSRRPAT